jgi:hypothetical protein
VPVSSNFCLKRERIPLTRVKSILSYRDRFYHTRFYRCLSFLFFSIIFVVIRRSGIFSPKSIPLISI